VTEAAAVLGGEGRAIAILDVRAPDEYAEGHIPGSRNIPLYELRERLGEVPDDRPVAVYCGSGTRSAIAASILSAQGGRRAIDMHDGFDGWQQQGGAVEPGVTQYEAGNRQSGSTTEAGSTVG
jgi:hydroxyacylglutathione hydrolase